MKPEELLKEKHDWVEIKPVMQVDLDRLIIIRNDFSTAFHEASRRLASITPLDGCEYHTTPFGVAIIYPEDGVTKFSGVDLCI